MKRLTIQLFNYWLVLLFLSGCSNEITLQPSSSGETVRLGKLVTRTGAGGEQEWQWRENDVITATTSGSSSLTATYTYGSGGQWGEASNADFTIEKIGVDAITLEFGSSTLTTDQSDAAKYRQADYLKGAGTISLLTLGGTLGHQHCDLVLTITQGTGWASETEFNNAMADASCVFVAGSGTGITDLTPLHSGNTFRAILPPENMVKGQSQKIATLTFGTTDNTPLLLRSHTATISYTNEVTELKNKRFIVNALLNTDCSVSITASINAWNTEDVTNPYPGEPEATN